jgi:hypothetical protein
MSSIGTASSHASKDEDHDDARAFESEAREVAASVLLLAATAKEEQEEAERERAEGNKTSTDSSNTTTIGMGSRPMKKRKNHDIRRSSTPEEGTAIHVSPLSRDAPEKGIRSTSRDPSFEAKEETGESIPKEAISSSLESSPTRTVAIPHFPSALHWLLTEAPAHVDVPDFALVHTVLHFLPHGQAFKIARWDALRREVIPKFFPQLEGVDDFLWLLTSWGFEEIKDGPDVGAYAHTVRTRQTYTERTRSIDFETRTQRYFTLNPAHRTFVEDILSYVVKCVLNLSTRTVPFHDHQSFKESLVLLGTLIVPDPTLAPFSEYHLLLPLRDLPMPELLATMKFHRSNEMFAATAR